MSVLSQVKLSQLKKSPLNVRTVEPKQELIKPLALNIFSVGLLQNLVVHEIKKNSFGILAGKRRFMALSFLLENKMIKDDYLVNVIIVDEEKAIEMSFSENSHTEPMHVYDQITAFSVMNKKGLSIDNIATSLGYSNSHVGRMLKLSNINPELLELLKSDEIKTDHLKKLSLIEDKDLQKTVWENSSNGTYLNAQIANLKVKHKNSYISKYVGLASYKKNGGLISKDLFSDDEDVYIDNVDLLNQLFEKKIYDLAKSIQKQEGWGFFRIYKSYSDKWESEDELIKVEPIGKREPTEEEKNKILKLENKINSDEGFYDQETEDELELLQESLDIFENTGELGFYIVFNEKPLIFRGYKFKAEIVNNDEEIKEPLIENKDKGIHTKDLIKNLTAFRSLIVQKELYSNNNLCLVLVAHEFIKKTFNDFGFYDSKFNFSLNPNYNSLINANTNFDQESLINGFLHKFESIKSKFPSDFLENYDYLLKYSTIDLIDIITFCFSLTYSNINDVETDNAQFIQIEKHFENFDIFNYWSKGENNNYTYLSKLSKKSIIDIASAFIDDNKKNELLKVGKKSELVDKVAVILNQNNYTPPLLK